MFACSSVGFTMTCTLHCRCHTFGIGPEVCVELVTDIAALSCGKCVLLKEGERLQTKVHCTLKNVIIIVICWEQKNTGNK